MDSTLTWKAVVTVFLSSSLFEKRCRISVRKGFHLWMLLERVGVHYRNQHKQHLYLPLRRDLTVIWTKKVTTCKQLTNWVGMWLTWHCRGDWVQCRTLCITSSGVQDCCNTWNDFRSELWYLFSFRRADVNHTLMNMNNTLSCILVFDGSLLLFQINSRKRGTKITLPWPGAKPCRCGSLKVKWNHGTLFTIFTHHVFFNQVLEQWGHFRSMITHSKPSSYSNTINKAEAKKQSDEFSVVCCFRTPADLRRVYYTVATNHGK